MSLFQISCLTIAVMSFIFGLFVLVSGWRVKMNRMWFLVSLATSFWGLGLFGVVNAIDYKSAWFWQYVLDASGILIPVFYFIFLLYFLKIETIHKKAEIGTFLLGFGLSAFSFTYFFKQGMGMRAGFNYWVEPGPFYFLFPLIFAFYIFLTFYLLIKAYRTTDNANFKQQIKYFICCQLVGFGGGVTNFFPQLFNVYPFGNYLVAIYIFFVSYAVLKHGLFNIKIFATELLTYAIWVFVLIRILLNDSLNGKLIDSGFLLILMVFGIFLIRSVSKEVKSKERLEKLTNSLHRANLELQKLDKAKSDFISIASHQLRTPLTVIKGFVSMMLEGSFGQINDVMRDKLNKTYESAERLIKLVNDLLDLSHMEGGKMRYEFKKVELAAMVQSVFEELAPQAARKNLKFEFNRPAGEFNVWADEEKLRQVAMNLIDNAIKYTKEGGVVLSLVDTGGQIEFSVKDTGLGMSPQEIPKLFQKFVRGTTAPRMYTDGSGIGLYVAKKVMDEHRGQIGAQSAGAGQGSTFFIKMPEYKDGMAPPVVAEAPTSQVPAAK